MFPENVIQATFQRVRTTYEIKNNLKSSSLSDSVIPGSAAITSSNNETIIRKKIENVNGMNILGFFLIFSIIKIFINKIIH